MSAPGTTEGEWKVEPGHSVVSITCNGQHIAATSSKPYYQAHDAVDLANAHQMAASGALYDALEDAAEILAELYPGFIDYSEPYNRGIELRDVAVAKALAALTLARGAPS